VAWYLTDWQGSTRNLIDGSGNLQDTISYDGFGNVISETNATFGDRFKYTGREADSATGLQYNRARFYDAKTGRWTGLDPLGFRVGDPNLYRYVRNSPTNAADGSGLDVIYLVNTRNFPEGHAAVLIGHESVVDEREHGWHYFSFERGPSTGGGTSSPGDIEPAYFDDLQAAMESEQLSAYTHFIWHETDIAK
jgi:RHS repeat-associated protein